MDRIIEELTTKYGNVKWINNHVSKGPIIIEWRNSDLWFLTDCKTEDYHLVNYRGRYILSGGNWRNPEDKTPSGTLKRQFREEFGELYTSLTSNITPFVDYLEVKSVSDHRSSRMVDILPETDGTNITIVSMFVSKVAGEQLQEELKIPSKESSPLLLQREIYKRSAKESDLAVMTLHDLLSGGLDNFGAGDGEKLRDYLQDTYGIHATVLTSRGTNYRLTRTTPLTPYVERDTLPYLRVNPLESDTIDPRASFIRLS